MICIIGCQPEQTLIGFSHGTKIHMTGKDVHYSWGLSMRLNKSFWEEVFYRLFLLDYTHYILCRLQ